MKYIESLMPRSIVKNFERGPRRYFPLPDGHDEALAEAFKIIFGKEHEDHLELGYAIVFKGLDNYVETFDDGTKWVRTIYKVDQK